MGPLGDPRGLGEVVKDIGYLGCVLGEGNGIVDVAVGHSQSSLTDFCGPQASTTTLSFTWLS